MIRTKILLGVLGAVAIVAWSGSVFAQQGTSTPTVEELQKQIQQLLGQMQTLRQEVVTMRKELEVRQTDSSVPTSQVPAVRESGATEDTILNEEEEIFTAPEITRTLVRGSRGNDVRRLQEFLAQDPSIYPSGSITGFFGIGTEAALKRWQAKHDLDPVGIFGRRTASKFRELNEMFRNLRSQEEQLEGTPEDQDGMQDQTRTRSRTRSSSERTRPSPADAHARELCPALPTVDSCPMGQERVITYSSRICGVYYACRVQSEHASSTAVMTQSTTTQSTTTHTASSSMNVHTTPPAGQKEQLWNSLGLRSWIRTDADATRIESLKQSCANVSGGVNIWSSGAGSFSSADFGMPSAEKCRLASACTSSQYFDGTSCVSGSSGGTSLACASLGSDWATYGNYCMNGLRTQYTPLSSPTHSSVQSCTGHDSPVAGCTSPGSTTSTSCSQYGTGWHTMGDGNCYDSEMRNYRTTNGTLYACSTTPASGCSSTPTTSTSCSQYGTGWHTMGDGNCYDSFMQNYRTANGTLYACSATPASGCSSSISSSSCPSGQYWNGTACVSSTSTSCPSGQYWNGAACVSSTSSTSCASNQYWNGTACVSPTTTTSCPSGQYWNGTACVTSTTSTSCASGQYWNGTACVTSTTSTSCASGQYWNGTACVATPTPTPTPTPSTTSCSSGQYWNGTACVSSTSSASCPSGQYWNGTACVTSTTSTSCPSGQYWNGTACATSSSGASAISALDLARIQALLQTLSSSLRDAVNFRGR